jgi:tetratricopeptide (TPR) repeat protein
MSEVLGPQEREALAHLKSALSLEEGFGFYLIIADTRRVLEEALKALWTAPFTILRPAETSTAETLITELESALGSKPVVLDATLAQTDAPHWKSLFRRLNERRNELILRHPAPFLLALSQALEPVLAHEAPDLWSIRSLTTRLTDRSPVLVEDTVPVWTSHEAAWVEDPQIARKAVEDARASGREDILADALNRLASSLANQGKREEALAAAQEATTLRRPLAKQNPDAFLPDLASSLNNLGNMLSALGKREEALAAAQEATTIRRQLAKRHPGILPDLARSLGALSLIHLSNGTPAEAIPIAAEGCQILLPFARQYPAALGELLRALASIYVDSCKASSHPPDPTLLQKLTPFLTPS